MEKIMEAINNQVLGGVTYNANMFTGKDLGNGKFELRAKNGGETIIFGEQHQREREAIEGEKADYYLYSDGTTGSENSKWIKNKGYAYGTPMKKTNPHIEMKTKEGWLCDDNVFTLTDIDGANFKSSNDSVSQVSLFCCSNVNADLAANDSFHYGDSVEIKGGENNTAILDKQDTAIINGKHIRGGGIAAQKDY